jgi:hypothetical protein
MVFLYTATTAVGWWENFSFKMLLIIWGSSSILLGLLHNGKKLPLAPLVHAVHMKETYATIQGLLQTTRYEDTCADLRVLGDIAD